MKRMIILLFIVFSFSVGFSQTTFDTETSDSTNVYYHSLKKLCEIFDTSNDDNPVFYVEKTLFTDKLPDRILDIKIEYLDEVEQLEKIKQKNGEMLLIRIVPLRLRNGIFFVNVIPFKAFYRKGNLELANGGGMKVEFIFNSELNGLVFEKAQFNGI